MKIPVLVAFLCLLTLHALAQGNNRKPRITGQDPISTNEDQSVTILMSYLEVEDADDWFYPWGFSMTLYPGENYTFQNHVVTPSPEFSGVLKVKVTVHDGQDESNKFDLQITVHPVNDKPVITGHTALTTDEGKAITILPSNITVSDPDDKYPDDFTFRIHTGNNYTVSGSQVTPATGFSGTLSVNVSVNDGSVDSDVYALPVTVKPVNRVPVINGQATLQVNEDQNISILLTHLIVTDEDNNYPEGFTLGLGAGQNYTFTGTTVTPAKDFFGQLTIPVTVNDGKNTSIPFGLIVTVTPVNDSPVITGLETEPIFYRSATSSVAITEDVNIEEVDGDSIMFAEVSFAGTSYRISTDKLTLTLPANGKIKGVFDANTGVLTLLGQASPASYALALRAVHYESIAPTADASKTIRITVNDGKVDSEPVERMILFGQASVSLDIPSGFTPNGDSSNDTWKIVPLKSEESYSGAKVKVYTKGGALVYESVGFEKEWDGRFNGEILPADTYFYTIDLNMNAPEGYLKGIVTILR